MPASVGFSVGKGTVGDVAPGTPADRAGFAPGMAILAVGDAPYSYDALAAALGKTGTIPFVVSYKGAVRTLPFENATPLRYPHLERIPGKPNRLGELVRPRRQP